MRFLIDNNLSPLLAERLKKYIRRFAAHPWGRN